MRGIGSKWIAAAVASVAVSGSANAAPFTWTSAASGVWSNAANWTPGVPASAADTVLNFNAVNATYTATNDLGTTATAPFVLNQLVLGTTGTPTVAGGFLSFAGATPTITKASGGGTPIVSSALIINNGLTVAGNATDAMSLTGAITGGGALNITGGSVSFSNGNSTYAGGLTLTAGELVVFADSALAAGSLTRGPLGTGTLSLNGGSVRTNSGNARVVSNAVSIGGNVGLDSGSGNTLTFAGPTTIAGSGATRTLTINGSKAALFTGAIGDAGGANGVTISGVAAGTGTLTLGGGAADVAANTFTGATTINTTAGSVILDKASGTNAIAGDLVYQAGTLTLNRANQIADTSNVTVNGTGTLNFGVDETVGSIGQSSGAFRVNGGTTTTVNGTYTLTGGTGPTLGGTLAVGGLNVARPTAGTAIYDAVTANNGTTAGTLRLNGNVTVNASTNAFGTRIRQGGAGGTLDLNGAQRTFTVGDGAAAEDFIVSAAVIDSVGGGGFRKAGAGTLALVNDAPNAVNGASVVAAGRLVVYNFAADPLAGLGATGGGLLSVSTGATLGGNGKVNAVSVSGTVDPSVPSASNLGGTFSATPTLVVASAAFSGGGTLQIDGVGSAATDRLTVNGLLDLSAALDTLSINGTVDGMSSYTLATYGSLGGAFDSVTFNGGALPAGYAVAYTSTAGPGSVVLQPTAVPEPATLGAVALGAAALLRRRRR